MIGKIISCASFAGTVGYVMKKAQSRILAAEGIGPPEVRDMVRDFKDQTLLNPRIKNPVGHISLSFSPKDAEKLSDEKMTEIAEEYMERMGIRDTQFLLVRHLDREHPHCHLVYNRVGNNGQTISDRNIKIRNGKVCKELTAKHGLYYAAGKEQVNRDRLREPDKTKYEIYDAIRACLPTCKSWSDLETRLQERGITTNYKYCGHTDRKQGVLFSKNGLTFAGSKIDRACGFPKIDRRFSQIQRRSMLVRNLSSAIDRYRSAFAGLFGDTGGTSGLPSDNGSLHFGGSVGAVPLPPIDSPIVLSAAQMQRKEGESPEEYIARITASIRQATEAMLAATEERKRKLRNRKRNTHKIGF